MEQRQHKTEYPLEDLKFLSANISREHITLKGTKFSISDLFKRQFIIISSVALLFFKSKSQFPFGKKETEPSLVPCHFLGICR